MPSDDKSSHCLWQGELMNKYSFLSECFVFTSTEKHTWPLKNLLGT
jgi:hypothetical protein